MKLLFAGTPEVAADVLKGLVSAGHEVALVLTREDAVVGRSKIPTPSAVALVSSQLQIPTLKSNRLTNDDLAKISKSGAELGIVVAYGSILKLDALDSLTEGWYNLHFSVLPKYRGAAPVQRALMSGETETGVTMFKLDEGMDTGPIVGQLQTAIGPGENAGNLLTRLGGLAVSLLLETLPRIYSGTHVLVNQVGEPSFASKPTREDARIDFSNSAQTIQHQVLGLNPEPMAWCIAAEAPMRVIDAMETQSTQILDLMNENNPGEIVSTEGRVFVKCGEGSVLELLEVQPSSKRAMSAKDWFNGNRKLEKLT